MEYQGLYKYQSRAADDTRAERFASSKVLRAEKRHITHLNARNISVDHSKKHENSNVHDERKKEEYKTKFLKWKQQKANRLREEKAKLNKKPPFLCVVSKNCFLSREMPKINGVAPKKSKEAIKAEENDKKAAALKQKIQIIAKKKAITGNKENSAATSNRKIISKAKQDEKISKTPAKSINKGQPFDFFLFPPSNGFLTSTQRKSAKEAKEKNVEEVCDIISPIEHVTLENKSSEEFATGKEKTENIADQQKQEQTTTAAAQTKPTKKTSFILGPASDKKNTTRKSSFKDKIIVRTPHRPKTPLVPNIVPNNTINSEKKLFKLQNSSVLPTAKRIDFKKTDENLSFAKKQIVKSSKPVEKLAAETSKSKIPKAERSSGSHMRPKVDNKKTELKQTTNKSNMIKPLKPESITKSCITPLKKRTETPKSVKQTPNFFNLSNLSGPSDSILNVTFPPSPDAQPLLPASSSDEANVTPETDPLNSSNYLSPFVTTSRGRFNRKREAEKRDSVYTLVQNASFEEPLEIRRCREAVKYFRNVLKNTIDRLLSLCEQWKLDGSNATDTEVDMISATVGQTRLLISSKFEQFRGLIDECESLENGSNSPIAKDKKQPISVEDLEGFWSMVYLQVENVEKRFEILQKWKANNWMDPEEEIPKPKNKNLTRVTKPKQKTKKPIKASGFITEIIKKAQLARKNKSDDIVNSADIQVEFVGGTKRRSIKTPPLTLPRQMRTRRSLLQTALLNNSRRRSTPSQKRRSEGSTSRKRSPRPQRSILKTPGTLRKNKSVLFSEELQFKSPDIDPKKDESLKEEDVNGSRKSIRLRSRSVFTKIAEA